jgi:hypothetical protein
MWLWIIYKLASDYSYYLSTKSIQKDHALLVIKVFLVVRTNTIYLFNTLQQTCP